MFFVGVDWAEEHHDVCVMDPAGGVLAKGRVTNDLAGIAKLHDLIAGAASDDVDDEPEVVVGIETDRGLLVRALVAAGYRVLAVNPRAVDRYRDRVRVSGAKSDPGDARVLADMVRTDAHQHRPVASDSDLAEAIKLVARSHQSAIWSRRRLANQVRSALREFYPAALEAFDDLTHGDALAVLAVAPHPRARSNAVTLEDRLGAAPGRSPAQHRHPGREDPHRAPGRAPRAARNRRRCVRLDRGVAHQGDRGPQPPDQRAPGGPWRPFRPAP